MQCGCLPGPKPWRAWLRVSAENAQTINYKDTIPQYIVVVNRLFSLYCILASAGQGGANEPEGEIGATGQIVYTICTHTLKYKLLIQTIKAPFPFHQPFVVIDLPAIFCLKN